MKALIITITQECNYTCKYCTMKGFIIPPGGKFENDLYPGVKITNKALIKWLKAYIRPAEWHIKITGGEPGLYKGIDKLLPALSKLGYKGIVETNGSLPVPNSDNFVRVGAWHKDRPQPKYFDVILITKNPDDDWRSKKDFCEVWDIPYKCAPFKHPGFHSNPNYDNPFPTLFLQTLRRVKPIPIWSQTVCHCELLHQGS